MYILFLNNWHFNTSLYNETDEDFTFDLFRIEYSWRYHWIILIVFNFEVRINWKGKQHVKGM